MPPIPDRWIPYKACGKIIEGTRIICFKVPLRKSVQQGNRDIKEIWDIPALLEKIPKLGAVIDLTNTTKYYNPSELLAAGVLHKKILIPGRIIPPENKVTEFMSAIDEFLGKNSDILVGVHCTHGLNRTGYLVCRYMRDRLGIPAKEAIKKFEKARGYEIERENFIADLLGNTPPPPDTGKETTLRPSRKNDMTYRSPLANDYEDQEYRHSGYGRRYGYDGAPSRSFQRNDDNRNRNWRDRSNDNKNYAQSSQRDRYRKPKNSTSSSDSNYNFKYDY